MLRSIGLGNSYFPTRRISESELGMLTEFRVSHLEIRHFRLQWNDISYWETPKYKFPSPMERSISPVPIFQFFYTVIPHLLDPVTIFSRLWYRVWQRYCFRSLSVCLSVCLSVSSLLQCLTLYSTHYRFVGHVFAAAGELLGLTLPCFSIVIGCHRSLDTPPDNWWSLGTTVFRGKFLQIPQASLPNSAAHLGKFSTYSSWFSVTSEPDQICSICRR